MGILSSIILIVVGLVVCFMGKKYIQVVLGLQAGLLSFIVASRVLLNLGQPELVAMVGAIVVGVIIGFIAYQFLYKWVYILFGALLGLAVVGLIESALGIQGILVPILAIVGVIIGAIIGNKLSDFIVELSTSVAGAASTTGGIGALSTAIGIGLPLADPLMLSSAEATSMAGIISIVVTFILAVMGFNYQRAGGSSK